MKMEITILELQKNVNDLMRGQSLDVRLNQLKDDAAFDVSERLIRKLDTKTHQLEMEMAIANQNSLESTQKMLKESFASQFEDKSRELENQVLTAIREETKNLNRDAEDFKKNLQDIAQKQMSLLTGKLKEMEEINKKDKEEMEWRLIT